MRRWVLVMVAACTSSQPTSAIDGTYKATPASCVGDTFDLVMDETVLLFNGNGLPADGSDSYTWSACTAVECQSMDGGILTYNATHIERTSSTTVAGWTKVSSVRQSCTNDTCPGGFGAPDAVPCNFTATRIEP